MLFGFTNDKQAVPGATRILSALFCLGDWHAQQVLQQVSVHFAQLRMLCQDGGVRTVTQQQARRFAVRLPARLVAKLVKALYRSGEPVGQARRLARWLAIFARSQVPSNLL